MYSYLKSEMRGLVFFGNGQGEVEVDGGVQLYIPLVVLCDVDFLFEAQISVCVACSRLRGMENVSKLIDGKLFSVWNLGIWHRKRASV